ncbi:MAG: efflux RND transporter periplasmic adaptor subunit [Phycisphaerae bacterium]|nr:efflux RND transporter periplasmic adaptor subunit [Phycisphaerae bacterium]MDW8263109.1 efflux RND transporter periplasmic adaptor subunit [Phycisphaerales bacterium]
MRLIPGQQLSSIVIVRASFVLAVLSPLIALGQMGPVPVELAPVSQGQLELSRPIVATVQAVVRSTVAAEEPGLVCERSFEEGQAVSRGMVLARINTDLLRTQLAAAEAGAQALQSQIEQASAEYDRAAMEVERMRRVIEQRAVPQKELDDAERDARVTAAVLANRRAMLAEKQAEVSRLRLMIEKSEVKAPFDAIVSVRHVEVGQWIRQGDPVAEIVQTDPVYVRGQVPESLVTHLREGDTVRVSIDALPGEHFEGRIAHIMPEADAGSRTFGVRILLNNPQQRIRPGFFARATFLTQSAPGNWLVPKDAVISQEQTAHVVAFRNGVAEIVPVQLLALAGQTACVRGELRVGDQVVIRGNESLRGGEPLSPRGGPSSAAGPPPASQPQG